MREILFRGKSKDNSEWVYGNLEIIHYDISDKADIRYGRTGDNYYIKSFDISDNGMGGYDTEVIPKTVGQFTGLEDKNGNKIFEGDILGGFCDMQIEIYYDEQHCQFRAREKGGFSQPIDYYCGYPMRFEVISNIYDNPKGKGE